MLAAGPLVKKFEEEMSRYLGAAGGVATSSGTDALFLALKALGVGRGDEVILPTYVCRSVWDAVAMVGATPVLCDISDAWCMSAETVERCLSARSKAVIVVHTFGVVAEATAIRRCGLPLIEDCCQALGARGNGAAAGAVGDCCVLSFHATKLLTTGEGGMLLARDPRLLERARALKGGGGSLAVRYRQPMSDLAAALGLSQLGAYEASLRRRREIADFYFRKLEGLPVSLPAAVRPRSIFFRFPLRVRGGDFEEIRRAFEREGVHVRRGVDALLHRECGLRAEDFPVAEQTFAETVSIPLYPSLTDEDCARVVAACCKIFGGWE